MFRKYVIISLAVLMSLGFTACTSKQADEGADVEVASGGDEALEEADATGSNDDLEGDSGSSGGGDMASDLEASDGDDLGGDLESQAAVSEDAGSGEVTPNDLSEAPPADAGAGDMSADALSDAPSDMAADAPSDAGGDMAATDSPPEPMAPPEPESAPAAPPIVPEPSGGDMASESSAPVVGGLKKINAQPYKHGKTMVNAVYIARDADTVESIAQKVGSDVKTICKINAYNCGRGIKVGDKYYYNSPQRPTDDAVVKTYYEDNGIPPEIYTAKAGDNIRAVSKELLGHDRSWMEVWATNDVESKGELDEGTQLKYWPAGAGAPAQTIAANETAATGGDMGAPADAGAPDAGAPPPGDMAGGPDAGAPPPPSDMAGGPDAGAPPPGDMGAPPPPPPPPDQMAQNDLPPTPDANAAGMVEPPPPPPPPPPADTGVPPGDMAMDSMQDPDQTMMLGVGAVLLLAAAALFISIRKKRQRRQIDFNTTTQTQIE